MINRLHLYDNEPVLPSFGGLSLWRVLFITGRVNCKRLMSFRAAVNLKLFAFRGKKKRSD